MKKLLTFLLAVTLLLSGTLARSEAKEVLIMQQARELLQHLDFVISDESYASALEQIRALQEFYRQFDIDYATSQTDLATCAYLLLMSEGIGQYDYSTFTWTPSSDKIYVFDAEFFNIEGMYTEFLQGVQAIVPDGQITDVQENLSEMTLEWDEESYSDGHRSVSFRFNGTPYDVRLVSYGDWINDEIITFMNSVLKAEGCPGQLHCVSDAYDQMVFLIYGDAKKATVLRQLMGVPEPETAPEDETFSLLDWLSNLFGS